MADYGRTLKGVAKIPGDQSTYGLDGILDTYKHELDGLLQELGTETCAGFSEPFTGEARDRSAKTFGVADPGGISAAVAVHPTRVFPEIEERSVGPTLESMPGAVEGWQDQQRRSRHHASDGHSVKATE